MKAQMGWLREHVELPEGAADVGARLTSLGFTLDGLERAGDDAVLEIDVGSNRPDALCHVGLARELAASLDRPLRLPEAPSLDGRGEPASSSLARVTVEAPDLCGRYAARVVRGVTVGPSPDWMARRLEACGIRPINVLVDVTNYVLLELGHPLHAFDLDRVEGRHVVVRRARAGETLRTLDGVDRALPPEALVIADAERATAVAGVMGGAGSEIRPTTRDVLIESAWFAPSSIRRTARALGMHTEASHRFERGTDPDVVPLALDRAAALVASLSGGSVLDGMLDVVVPAQPLRQVRLRRARLHRLGGVHVEAADVARILSALGFEIATSDAAGWTVLVPRRRGDVSREVDLVEEVLRVHGYDKVPATLPPFREGARPRSTWERGIAAARASLAAAGWLQAVSLSFDDPPAVRAWADSVAADGPSRLVEVENPIAENLSVLRPSLLPGLLRALSTAARRGERDVRLFEEGSVFLAAPGGASPVEERTCLALVARGRRTPRHFATPGEDVDVLTTTGALFGALLSAGASRGSLSVTAADVPRCGPGAARVLLDGEPIGWVGRLHPDVLRALDVDDAAHAAEVDLTRVLVRTRDLAFAVPPRHPNVVRDASILVDRNRAYGAIIAPIEALRERSQRDESFASGGGSAPIESVQLVDRYLGKGVPEGKVSLTFSISYRARERTLTQEEVDRRHAELVGILVADSGAVLRA